MCLIDTKTVQSTANVFNKMESKTIDTERINMLLSITPVYRKKSMKYAFQDASPRDSNPEVDKRRTEYWPFSSLVQFSVKSCSHRKSSGNKDGLDEVKSSISQNRFTMAASVTSE